MPTPAVTFDGVWKKFRRGVRHDSLRDLIPAAIRRLGRPRSGDLDAQEFWGVRDVSFRVEPGEALGIIGRNGAGKSTTLKLLTRILRPTRGHSRVTGRIGALIEVAAGFHPDLTGRENVFLQGSIMGMRRTEIASKLDAIVEFAGVQEFVDTQVKRYSSGMNARLGFAIAAHLDPEVLIIDEVLSVGDTEFQQRCLERMQAFRRSGVPIVFVSHNLSAVESLCSQAALLERGCLAAVGPPAAVIARYLSSSAQSGARSGSHVAFEDVTLCADGVPSSGRLHPGARVALTARFRCIRPVRDLVATFVVREGIARTAMFAADTTALGCPRFDADPGEELLVEVDFTCNLLRGTYFVELQLFNPSTMAFYEHRSPLVVFSVEESVSRTGCAALYPSAQLLVGRQINGGAFSHG
jgi:homopolymeric O-antigen transport system ATP-binding protein